MIGAIAGDIIGSPYEHARQLSKRFVLFGEYCNFTDDTVLTVAVASVLLGDGDYAKAFHDYFNDYPRRGFGGRFYNWAINRETKPYNSFGNGSAMRVSPIGWAFDTIEEVLAEAKQSAEVTHSHPEGIKGAQAAAAAILWARKGYSKDDIRSSIGEQFGYDLGKSLDEIRPDYSFDVTCQGSVPPSIIAFLESTDYEDAVRNAISLGGDADTMACIAGGIAEAFYGIPDEIVDQTMERLDERLSGVVSAFRREFDRER